MDEFPLIKVKDVIPLEYQAVFPFESFNEMQTSLFKQIYESDVNMTVASPTGSGKTVICELAILRLLKKYSMTDLKCILITPNKALCQQKMNEWHVCFGSLGLSVLELTGDSLFEHSLRLVAKANIIITTPEKWDAMTRSWRQHIFLLGAIDLLLVDEIHHLGEDNRGATLEAVIVRMRTLNDIFHEKAPPSAKMKTPMRIVSLSAALPNVSDIGEWLQCLPDSIHYFDETFRPIPLSVHTIAYGSMNNMFLFERSLDNKVEEVIKRYSGGKQSLVFCASKSGCERLSQLLSQRFQSFANPGAYSDTSGVSQIQDAKLKNLVRRGHGFHHAGIPADDRVLVEQLFKAGKIRVLCATSTLAHGVNLPAHLVIIKGTNQWRGGSKGYQKMSKSMILQMTGRAGRPGFDSSGVAVIMTSREDKEFFSCLDLDVVESTLPGILTETICAEVSQRVIQTVSDCVAWLKNTYFFIRVKQNPVKYGFSVQLHPEQLEACLEDICVRALEDLKRADIVEYNDEECIKDAADAVSSSDCDAVISVLAKPAAHIMTKHMVKLSTMSALMNIPSTGSLYDVITTVSKADEVAKPVQRSEKKVLNELMKDVRFPLKKLKVQEPFHKAYVLLLSAVYKNSSDSFNATSEQNNTHSVLTDFALRVQQSEIVEQSLRLLSALFDYCIEKSKGQVTLSCVYLARALKIQMWEQDFHVFDQCAGLSFILNARLRRENIHEIDDVLSTPSSTMQKTLRCSREDLQQLYTFAKKEKCSGLTANFQPFFNNQHRMTSFKVTVSTRIATTGNVLKYQAFFQANRLYHLVVYDNRTSELLCYRRFYSKLESVDFHVKRPSGRQTSTNVDTGGKVKCSVSVNLICDSVVGQDFSTIFPPIGTVSEGEDEGLAAQHETSSSANNRNKVRRATQSLLSFPTPSPTKKKIVPTGMDEGDNQGHLSDYSSTEGKGEQTRNDNAKKKKRKQTSSSSSVSGREDKEQRGGKGKRGTRKKSSHDANKSSMFGVFEYQPLRDQKANESNTGKRHQSSTSTSSITRQGFSQKNRDQSPTGHASTLHLPRESQPNTRPDHNHALDLRRHQEGMTCAPRLSSSSSSLHDSSGQQRGPSRNSELSLLRSKAFELQLDQTPIQKACRRLTELSKAPPSPPPPPPQQQQYGEYSHMKSSRLHDHCQQTQPSQYSQLCLSGAAPYDEQDSCSYSTVSDDQLTQDGGRKRGGGRGGVGRYPPSQQQPVAPTRGARYLDLDASPVASRKSFFSHASPFSSLTSFAEHANGGVSTGAHVGAGAERGAAAEAFSCRDIHNSNRDSSIQCSEPVTHSDEEARRQVPRSHLMNDQDQQRLGQRPDPARFLQSYPAAAESMSSHYPPLSPAPPPTPPPAPAPPPNGMCSKQSLSSSAHGYAFSSRYPPPQGHQASPVNQTRGAVAMAPPQTQASASASMTKPSTLPLPQPPPANAYSEKDHMGGDLFDQGFF